MWCHANSTLVDKNSAVTGIGSANIVGVKVDHGARVDLSDLEAKLQHCLDNEIAVYAVEASGQPKRGQLIHFEVF